jgi:1-phosphatidylinositol-4-phosphate 5-kinase
MSISPRRFGVDDETYLTSILSKGVSEISTAETGSKSGQKFLISADGRYFMKTITKSESKFFRKTLAKYYVHVKEDRNTLLCRFFGMHRVKPGGMHLIVMCNIFDTDRAIHQRYDLKGSTVGRAVPENERLKATVIYKDLDFKERLGELRLGAERKKLLMDQIRSDASFLASIGVMDYSLLVGVHNRSLRKSSLSAAEPRESVAVLEKKIKRKQHLLRTGSLMLHLKDSSTTHTSTFQEDDGGWSLLPSTLWCLPCARWALH